MLSCSNDGHLDQRRWQRHEADLPVSIAVVDSFSRPRVRGRATETSEGGMAPYAGVEPKPHDFMAVAFLAPSNARGTEKVRDREGYCFGLEFLAPLRIDREADGTT